MIFTFLLDTINNQSILSFSEKYSCLKMPPLLPSLQVLFKKIKMFSQSQLVINSVPMLFLVPAASEYGHRRAALWIQRCMLTRSPCLLCWAVSEATASLWLFLAFQARSQSNLLKSVLKDKSERTTVLVECWEISSLSPVVLLKKAWLGSQGQDYSCSKSRGPKGQEATVL